MKKLCFALSIGFILFSSCADDSPGPITDIGIYINEIRSTGGDWLELYNSTATVVNIAGFKIYDDPTDKFTIPSGSIPAMGFIILNCDGTGVGGNTSFKLSSVGETVYLEDKSGNLIDQVTFPELINGTTYARFPDGGKTWNITGLATKNATNGNNASPSISSVSRSPLVPGINDNVTISATINDFAGINVVKLFFRLNSNSFASVNMTLAGGIYSGIIPAQNNTGLVEYYIEAININNGKTVDPDNAPNQSHSYLLNTDDISGLQAGLKINEFMTSNTSCCPDNSTGTFEFDDWIEIYNGTASPVDINGYYLSDNSGNPFKFRIEGSTIIPANGFLLIWADEQGSQGKLHVNFQLSSDGEDIGLYYIDGRPIDTYTFNIQTENTSWGRTTDGAATWKLWSIPTPGTTNQ
jgi:hypothetical protein